MEESRRVRGRRAGGLEGGEQEGWREESRRVRGRRAGGLEGREQEG